MGCQMNEMQISGLNDVSFPSFAYYINKKADG